MARSFWVVGALTGCALSTLACSGLLDDQLEADLARLADDVAASIDEAPVAQAPSTPVATKTVTTKARAAPQTTAAAPVAAAPKKGGGRGQLQVQVGANAVAVYIDGVPAEFDRYESYVMYDLPPGDHVVEVQNAFGKVVTSATIAVDGGRRSRLQYAKKTLTDLGSVPSVAQKKVAAPVVVQETPKGSLQIAGLSAYGDTVWLGGKQVPFDSAAGAFVYRGLAAGSYELRVEGGGQVVYAGPIDVIGGQNHRCFAGWTSGWTFDCHWTQPAL